MPIDQQRAESVIAANLLFQGGAVLTFKKTKGRHEHSSSVYTALAVDTRHEYNRLPTLILGPRNAHEQHGAHAVPSFQVATGVPGGTARIASIEILNSAAVAGRNILAPIVVLPMRVPTTSKLTAI